MGAEIYENVISAGTKGVCLLDQRGGKALVYNNVISTSGTAFAKAREEYLDSINPPESSPNSGQSQHVSDSYYWGNRKNVSTIIGANIPETIDYGGNLGVVPQENRDVWFEKSGFNGTSGVGLGPLANRPTTCTVGVAYWATDTNTLYNVPPPAPGRRIIPLISILIRQGLLSRIRRPLHLPIFSQDRIEAGYIERIKPRDSYRIRRKLSEINPVLDAIEVYPHKIKIP